MNISRRSLALLAALALLGGALTLALPEQATAFSHKKKKGGKSLQVKALEAKAKKGDANAQFAMGAAYAQGNGVKKDKGAAVQWYYKSGETYLKEGKTRKAQNALTAINQLAPGHKLGIKLAAKLKGK